MSVYILKTSRIAKPQTFYVLESLIEAIRQDLIRKRDGMGTGKITVEVKK